MSVTELQPGKIVSLIQHQAMCAVCKKVAELSFGGSAEFERYLSGIGWDKIKALGWVCTTCVVEKGFGEVDKDRYA